MRFLSLIIFFPLILSTPLCPDRTALMLMFGWDGDRVTTYDVVHHASLIGMRGIVAASAPSDTTRLWFESLGDWRRLFLRGTYDSLQNIHQTATIIGMHDLYDCLGYGPESGHNAGNEALLPWIYVPLAEALAHQGGKCLVYGPSIRDYEENLTADQDELTSLIGDIAPHVDVWVVQGLRQTWVDVGNDPNGDPYTIDDFQTWVAWWNSAVKSANPLAEMWVNLRFCIPQQSLNYFLDFQQAVIGGGANGVWFSPLTECQSSQDPLVHESYIQSLELLQDVNSQICQSE